MNAVIKTTLIVCLTVILTSAWHRLGDEISPTSTTATASAESAQIIEPYQPPQPNTPTAPHHNLLDDAPAISETMLSDGEQWLEQSAAAVAAVNTMQLQATFQLATAAKTVQGNLEVQAARPHNMRVAVRSSTGDLDGSTVTMDRFAGWVYSPAQQTFYFSQTYPGTPHLANQPELHQLVAYARQVWQQGSLGDGTATVEGTERLNGAMTTVVQISPTQAGHLEGVTVRVWLDQTTYLPRQIEVQAMFNGIVGTGRMTVESLTVNQPVDPTVFAFNTPPEGTVVVDLDAIGRMGLTALQPTEATVW